MLFVVYPTISHYISVLPISKAQKALGNSVYIGGTESYRYFVERQGFNFCKLEYYESFDLSALRLLFVLFLKSFRKQFMQTRYKEFLRVGNHLVSQVANAGVSDVFLDAHLSFYCIFVPKAVRVTIVNTKLSTLKSNGVPPLSSGVVLKAGLLARLWSDLIWYQLYLHNLLAVLKRRIAFHGADDSLFIRRVLSKRGLRYKDVFIPECKAAFYHEVNLDRVKLRTVITGLEKLEYEWKILHREETYFKMQPLMSFAKMEEWTALQSFIERYKETALLSDVRLIYVAFGTITQRHSEQLRKFINKLITAFDRTPGYMVIISTGGISCDKFGVSDNIFLSRRVPQANVLEHCAAMITHGGMNSIRECFHFKVPMLVYPLRKFDQPGNAARVQYHKLGLKGSMRRDSVRTILKKTNIVANMDRNCFRSL